MRKYCMGMIVMALMFMGVPSLFADTTSLPDSELTKGIDAELSTASDTATITDLKTDFSDEEEVVIEEEEMAQGKASQNIIVLFLVTLAAWVEDFFMNVGRLFSQLLA